jgi:hypothetical protein
MRSYALASVVAAGAAALALSMVLVNFAYEAAGSVPDIEGCGFLAGSLLSLALIYPSLAGVFGGRVARTLSRRSPSRAASARAGAAVGALGSGIYFGVGSLSVLRGPHGAEITPNLWALAACFVLACAWAGKIGATIDPGNTLASLRSRAGH